MENFKTITTNKMLFKLKYVKEIYENSNKKEIYKVRQLKEYNKYLDSLPLGKPLDTVIVLSEFGWRTDPISKTRKFHYGIDLLSHFNEPIIATGNGIIIKSEHNKSYGNYVKIKHTLGYSTLYSHLNKIVVKKDQRILKGDTVGYAGKTGRASGVHLHYEIILNDNNIDPFKYLKYYNLEKNIIE